jgi:choline transport protein
MHTYGDEPIASVANRENGDRMIVEDDTSRNKGATLNDQNDMKRLGKTQELRVGCGALTRSLMYNYWSPACAQRNFRFLSIFGYSLLLGNGWVLTMIGLLVPLSNGGTAGTAWMYLIVIIIMMFSTLSMAEMASMAPTAWDELPIPPSQD